MILIVTVLEDTETKAELVRQQEFYFTAEFHKLLQNASFLKNGYIKLKIT